MSSSEKQNFGWDNPPSPYGRKGVIARPEKSAKGNVILRCGNELEGGGWEQSVYVVLTPGEAREFYDAFGEQIERPDRWAMTSQYPTEYGEWQEEAANGDTTLGFVEWLRNQ